MNTLYATRFLIARIFAADERQRWEGAAHRRNHLLVFPALDVARDATLLSFTHAIGGRGDDFGRSLRRRRRTGVFQLAEVRLYQSHIAHRHRDRWYERPTHLRRHRLHRVTTDGGIIPPDAVLLLPFSRGGDASGCEYVGTQINASTDAPGSYVLTVSKDGYAQASVSGSIATFCSCLAQSCPAAPQRSVVLAPVSTQGQDASLDSGSVD